MTTSVHPSLIRAAAPWRGKLALITGASSGIGEEFARALAAAGAQLVLVARSAARLEELAAELRSTALEVTVMAIDLTQPAAPAQLVEELHRRGKEVQLLINNAGVATLAKLQDLSLESLRSTVLVNNLALAELTHAVLPGMLARRRGHILHVGSTAGYQAVPYMATYAASKAFVLSFSEALWAECRGSGVHVTAVSPGPVNTPFLSKLGNIEGLPLFRRKLSMAEVVRVSLRALVKNRCSVVVGGKNALLAFSARLLPRSVAALIGITMFRPRRPAQLAASLATAFVLLFHSRSVAESTASLRIEVSSFRNQRGRLGCQLFASGDGFPERGHLAETDSDVRGEAASCTFRNVKPGSYAVAVLHDENKNRQVDKNLFGVPKEGYGVSNNKTHAMRAPSWQDSKFALAAGESKVLKVRLRY